MKNFSDYLYLSDIGHTNAKIWRDGNIETIPLQKFKPEQITQKIFYINVNHQIQKTLSQLPNWIDLKNYFSIKTNYPNLGIDRKVAIFEIENGIVVDLGTAITIDILKNGTHLGGYILLGKSGTLKTFQEKTPHLKFQQISENSEYPNLTENALYFGFFQPIINFIQSIQAKENLKIILTGGDAQEFFNLINFPATLNKNLIFENMQKIVKYKNLK
jgi:type III pantothenate kinase